MRFGDEASLKKITEIVKKTAEKHGLTVVRADDQQYHDNTFENIQTYLHGCGFGIALFERFQSDAWNANVAFEVGYMKALGKPVLLLKDRTIGNLQADLIGKLYKQFDPETPEETIPVQLEQWFADNGITVRGQT